MQIQTGLIMPVYIFIYLHKKDYCKLMESFVLATKFTIYFLIIFHGTWLHINAIRF